MPQAFQDPEITAIRSSLAVGRARAERLEAQALASIHAMRAARRCRLALSPLAVSSSQPLAGSGKPDPVFLFNLGGRADGR